tara:strand:+ start:1454 stop:1867 length:414 start_codon:yes stop_codon:yes gene_type:complete
MKIVLDVNVLVSATFWTGASFKILKQCDEGKLEHITSLPILEEYADVLQRDEILDKQEKYALHPASIVKRVLDKSHMVEPSQKVDVVMDDPDDNKFLEAAVKGKAKVIITQDKHILKLESYKSILIITPEDFLKKYF